MERKYEQLVLSVLSKLVLNYLVFVSTFHATKNDLGACNTMQSLSYFVVSVTKDKDKLIQMGTMKHSNPQALVASEQKDS